MPAEITITTGARLHFGPFAVGAKSGPAFGGMGMMITDPSTVIRVATSDQDRLIAPSRESIRIKNWLEQIRGKRPDAQRHGFEIELIRSIPPHCGLGAGTQLAMAFAASLMQLLGDLEKNPQSLADLTERGRRSAVGVHGFLQGGFLVDQGKHHPGRLGKLQTRIDYPEEWPILLWVPKDRQGLSGSSEVSAFESLPPMSPDLTRRLRFLCDKQVVPALRHRNYEQFARALTEYGRLVGDYFRPVQEGAFAHPRAEEVIHWMGHHMASAGYAQTSWGPTMAFFFPDESTSADMQRRWAFCPDELISVRPLNQGASVVPSPG